MSVFKRKVRGQKLKTWTAKFVFDGKPRIHHGFASRDAAQHWIDQTRTSLRNGQTGYTKVRRTLDVSPLIDDYAAALEDERGRDAKYAYIVRTRLHRLRSECGWLVTGDITSDSFEHWRSRKPKYRGKVLGAKTLNQYLDLAQQFAAWLHKARKVLAANPFADVEKRAAPANAGFRRAGTVDELQKLLAVSRPDRAMYYRFLIYIPLRGRAMRGICWRDADLDGERPTLTLPANLSKTKHAAKLAIRSDLAESLRAYRGDAGPNDPIFPMPPRTRELREDLAAAGVAFDDGKNGRRLDLHAFRKTCVRLLKRAGVSLDEVHVFLQHKDHRTTAKFYDDDQVDAGVMSAAEKMPAISIAGVGAQVVSQNATASKEPK